MAHMGDPMISARGFGVAATPWRAAQRAAWAALVVRGVLDHLIRPRQQRRRDREAEDPQTGESSL